MSAAFLGYIEYKARQQRDGMEIKIEYSAWLKVFQDLPPDYWKIPVFTSSFFRDSATLTTVKNTVFTGHWIADSRL